MASQPNQNEILAQGYELFVQQDYYGATRRFNILLSRNADSTSADDRFIALDLRAAAFIKLGDPQAAFEDGRRMIKLKRGDPQGYLRTGIVCEHLQQPERALGVYEFGLKNVLPSAPRFSRLQFKRDWMIRKCKTGDPLQVLPLDLVEMVMKHLSFPNVTQLLRVSKLWGTTLASLPSLWAYLDLGAAQRPVPISTVRHYLVQSKNRLIRASVCLSRSRNDVMLSDALLRCSTLKHLDINLANGLDDCILLKSVSSFAALQTLVVRASSVLWLDRVIKLLGSCKELTRAEFHHVRGMIGDIEWTDNVSGIQSLVINAVRDPSARLSSVNLTTLIERIPKVEQLRCRNWSLHESGLDFTMLQNLRTLDLSNSKLWTFPWLPESIEVLNLCNCEFPPDRTFPSPLQDSVKSNHLPNLKALLLAHMHGLLGDGLRSLLSANKGNLLCLNLALCSRLVRNDISSLIEDGYFGAITFLSLAGCDFTDETAQLLAMAAPSLEHLELEQSAVTGVGVKALVLKPGRKLEKLKLDSNRLVSADAIHFARDSKINVQLVSQEEGLRMRRLRQR